MSIFSKARLSSVKTNLLKKGRSVHNLLGLVGGLTLFLFALSGITHLIMTWTGPQAAVFFPPRATMTSALATQVPATLARAGITTARTVKVIAADKGVLLQVTEDHNATRRYFNLESGDEVLNFDQHYAAWLARYYSGKTTESIRSISLLKDFSTEYPWVNRLLPVYRIEFETEDDLTLFIHTELSALADITNSRKRVLQRIFQWFHTGSFLEDSEVLRVIVIALLMITLISMTTSGVLFIVLMRSRRMPLLRRIHRSLGYFIALPLFALSSSGLYHLLYGALSGAQGELRNSKPMIVTAKRFGEHSDGLQKYQTQPLSSLSLINGPEGDLLFRLGVLNGGKEDTISRERKFSGTPTERGGIFISVTSGEELSINDEDICRLHAQSFAGPDATLIKSSQITQFGPDYDFRNKRLPVWRFDFVVAGSNFETIFIDPASGALVDRVSSSTRRERFSFSLLHKWNFLVGVCGRAGRDALLVGVLLASLIAASLGYWIRRGRKAQ